MAAIAIKQGATLTLNLQWAQDDGTPLDVSAGSIKAQVADLSGNLVATLTIAPIAGMTGAYTATSPTATWPIGTLMSDVALTLGGVTMFSDTFQILVGRAVTTLP